MKKYSQFIFIFTEKKTTNARQIELKMSYFLQKRILNSTMNYAVFFLSFTINPLLSKSNCNWMSHTKCSILKCLFYF